MMEENLFLEETQKNVLQSQDAVEHDPNAALRNPDGYTPVGSAEDNTPTLEVNPNNIGEVSATSPVPTRQVSDLPLETYGGTGDFLIAPEEEGVEDNPQGLELIPLAETPNVRIQTIPNLGAGIIPDNNDNNPVDSETPNGEVVDEVPEEPAPTSPAPPVEPPVEPTTPEEPEPPAPPEPEVPEVPEEPPVEPPTPDEPEPEVPEDPEEPEEPEPPAPPEPEDPEEPEEPEEPEPPNPPEPEDPEEPEPPAPPEPEDPEDPEEPEEPEPPNPPEPPEPEEPSGQNPGNNKDVGNSPFDGITGNSGNNGDKTPGSGPMEGGEDDEGEQPGFKGNGPSNANGNQNSDDENDSGNGRGQGQNSQRDNGWGNGDDDAPGGSGPNNNGENDETPSGNYDELVSRFLEENPMDEIPTLDIYNFDDDVVFDEIPQELMMDFSEIPEYGIGYDDDFSYDDAG
jgi:hypothetical protein